MARVPFRSLPSHRAECSTTKIDGHFTWDGSLMGHRIGPHERRHAQNIDDLAQAVQHRAQHNPRRRNLHIWQNREGLQTQCLRYGVKERFHRRYPISIRHTVTTLA